MVTKFDIVLSRAQIEQLYLKLQSNPQANCITSTLSVDVVRIDFIDSYTSLVCGTEISSTVAKVVQK